MRIEVLGVFCGFGRAESLRGPWVLSTALGGTPFGPREAGAGHRAETIPVHSFLGARRRALERAPQRPVAPYGALLAPYGALWRPMAPYGALWSPIPGLPFALRLAD